MSNDVSLDPVDKARLVDSLLESLHYSEVKSKPASRSSRKEDLAVIEHLRDAFNIPAEAELRSHLIEAVDFSQLFAEILKLAEPFARMLNEVYGFLSKQKTTARSIQRLVVGESIGNQISFDLDAFPVYLEIVRQIESSVREYDGAAICDPARSPLFSTESLLGCGHCTDGAYPKTEECADCGPEMVSRFEETFRQLEQLIGLVPDQAAFPYRFHIGYFEQAREGFKAGTHWEGRCRGYLKWGETLDEIDARFDSVSESRRKTHDIKVLERFFELPFWKERNRLYEVWTLVHFIQLLRGVHVELNVKDGQWYLIYSDSREPVGWLHGQGFDIEIYYQHKLKDGLRVFPDDPVEPEMIFRYRKSDGTVEPLILVECKERWDYEVREIHKLALLYRAQVNPALSIFCNYYNYKPPTGVSMTLDEPPIIFCDMFRPGGATVAEVDRKFIQLVNEKLGVFIQAVLVDVSGSMSNLDVGAVYAKLWGQLSEMQGSKTIAGLFADEVKFYDREQLTALLRDRPNLGGGTRFGAAISKLRGEIQKEHQQTSVINFYVITDVDFDDEDWRWLEEADADSAISITFVFRDAWVPEQSRQKLNQFKRIRRLTI